MKNRFLFFMAMMSIASSATITSCQKEEQDVTNSFSATMEDCADREDKTSLVNNRLFWERGDEVMIYGSSNSGVFTAEPNAHNATQAEFVGSTNLGSAPYCAIYPASIAVSRNSVNLPAVQTSPDGSPKGLPMYEQTNNRNLHFHNLCGLLKLHLTKPGVTIASVTFVAEEGTTVSGGFSVAYNHGNLSLTPTGLGRNWVRLQCTTPQSIATGGDFYIYLPAGNYQNFRIEIRTSDGQICTKTSNAPKTLVIERGYCTTLTLGSSHLTFVPDLAAELVDGPTFNLHIPSVTTSVVFEYNSPVSSGTLLSTSNSPYPIYGNLDDTVWRISTFVSKMNANPDCSYMFSGAISKNADNDFSSIIFGDGFNTENVINMEYMFTGLFHLTIIDLSGFNTSNVTSMSRMFEACFELMNMDVSCFNTSNVTDMNGMFSMCYGLTSLDVSNFNTSNVTDMDFMFGECHGLTSLDVSNFNTSNVTNMGSMFYGCSGLLSLDVSNFNTSNVTNMRCMFWGCSGLTSLNLSNFDMSGLCSDGKTKMCKDLSSTSEHCTITCPLAVENAIKEVDPDYDSSNPRPEWDHECYYYSGLPTSGVTFTWVRQTSSK